MATLLLEGFEGAGYETAGWTEGAETGCTVNEDAALPGTPPPGSGAQCLNCINVDATNNQAYTYSADIGADQPINYVRFYLYIDTEGLNDGQGDYTILLYNAALTEVAAYIAFRQSVSVLQLGYVYYSGGALQVSTWINISLDTWYLVEFQYDTTNLLWEWKLDGVSQQSGAMVAAVRTANRRLIAGLTGTGAGSTSIFIDRIAWGNSQWFGGLHIPTVAYYGNLLRQ